MIAIIVRHPLRRIMSNNIQRAARAPIPIEMEEMMVSASGGLYEDSFSAILQCRQIGNPSWVLMCLCFQT